MLRLFASLAVIVILGAAFARLADSPAQLVLLLPGWRVSFSPAAALAAALAAAAALWLIFGLIRFLLAPLGWQTAWRRYKKAAACQNLSAALIAGFCGDSPAARQKQAASAGALPPRKEPLSALALAQISAAEKEEAAFFGAQAAQDAARGAQKQAETLWRPLLRQSAAQSGKAAALSSASLSSVPAGAKPPPAPLQLLALKMLFSAASAAGDEKAARDYAAQAARLSPACLWASLAAAAAEAQAGEWQAAQDCYENFARARARQIKHDSAAQKNVARGRQALLCAYAGALFARRPHEARALALEAHSQDEDFSPAAVLAAEILFRLDEWRKAEKLLLRALSRAPNEDLARAYISAGDTLTGADKQWARARALAERCPKAEAAQRLAAKWARQTGHYQAAQKYAETAAALLPARQNLIMLAALAARRGADKEAGRLLARALAAAPAKAWRADGETLSRWQALSPKSRRLGGCQWQTPPISPLTAEEETLLRALQDKAGAEAADEAGEKSGSENGKTSAEAAAPLHGFARGLSAARQADGQSSLSAPAHINVDNPGVEGAKAAEAEQAKEQAAAAKPARAGRKSK